MLQAILRDEEQHVDWTEAQQDQSTQMGLAQFLAEQVG